MSEVISLGAIVVFMMLLVYMGLGNIVESYHCTIGHEAAFTILIGMAISFALYISQNEELIQMLKFSDNAFFFVCLPPIVFASGFNMQRGNFFANIKNVLMFGILGTFVAFSSFSALTIYLKDLGYMTQYDTTLGEWSPLELKNTECLLMCSLLCSSDVIAAVSLISYDKQPRLFSIVFGEGIINDAVQIILFNTVMKYTSENSEITSDTPLNILKEFGKLGLNSLVIGVVFGLMSSYILKRYRFFSKSAIHESIMIFCFGYLSYLFSELNHNSGIITLLTSGVVMAHYTWYNLSPQGKQSSYMIFQFLGYVFEAFVFGYLGLTFFSYTTLKWSPELFLTELGIIMFGRGLGTMGLVGVMKLIGYDAEISIREIIFIWYAGMIRGAIAFGLVLRIDGTKFANRDVIVTTSLSLVVFTTVIFGSTVGLLSKALFKNSEEEKHEKKPRKICQNQEEHSCDYQEFDVASSTSSHAEEMLHPNQQKETTPKFRTGASKYLKRFDELIMRPLFIYKYERGLQKKSKEFFDIFMNQGDEIEKNIGKESRRMKKQMLQEDSLINVQFNQGNNSEVGRSSIGSKSQLSVSYSMLSISKQFKKTRRRLKKKKDEDQDQHLDVKINRAYGNQKPGTSNRTNITEKENEEESDHSAEQTGPSYNINDSNVFNLNQ